MATTTAPSRRTPPYLQFLRLAAAVGTIVAAASCSDSPKLGVPTGGGLPGPGDGGEALRQQVELDGQFVAGLRLEGSWQVDGPGQAVTIAFVANGLAGVKQFEFIVKPTPAGAFDLENATFATDTPFITLPGGVRMEEETNMRMGGASLASPVSGTQTLGTLSLSTGPSYRPEDGAQLNVVLVSIGPTSTQRDRYDGDDLRLGVVLE